LNSMNLARNPMALGHALGYTTRNRSTRTV
jgi:hypothetical protein